jgi:hypothetical protein
MFESEAGGNTPIVKEILVLKIKKKYCTVPDP